MFDLNSHENAWHSTRYPTPGFRTTEVANHFKVRTVKFLQWDCNDMTWLDGMSHPKRSRHFGRGVEGRPVRSAIDPDPDRWFSFGSQWKAQGLSTALWRRVVWTMMSARQSPPTLGRPMRLREVLQPLNSHSSGDPFIQPLRTRFWLILVKSFRGLCIGWEVRDGVIHAIKCDLKDLGQLFTLKSPLLEVSKIGTPASSLACFWAAQHIRSTPQRTRVLLFINGSADLWARKGPAGEYC